METDGRAVPASETTEDTDIAASLVTWWMLVQSDACGRGDVGSRPGVEAEGPADVTLALGSGGTRTPNVDDCLTASNERGGALGAALRSGVMLTAPAVS